MAIQVQGSPSKVARTTMALYGVKKNKKARQAEIPLGGFYAWNATVN